MQLATGFIANGDAVSASSILKQGEEYADAAVASAGNDRPSGWENVGNKLLGAANRLKDGISSERSYLDDQKPSEGASATSAAGEAMEYVNDATHSARLQYEGMGGKWSDLEDLQSLQNNVNEALKAASGQ